MNIYYVLLLFDPYAFFCSLTPMQTYFSFRVDPSLGAQITLRGSPSGEPQGRGYMFGRTPCPSAHTHMQSSPSRSQTCKHLIHYSRSPQNR